MGARRPQAGLAQRVDVGTVGSGAQRALCSLPSERAWPPLTYLPTCRPTRRTRAERRRQAEVIQGALALSRSAAELMLPVARRRLDREQRHGGLVVVLALYGEEAAVLDAAKAAPQRWQQAQTAAAEQQAQQAAGDQQQAQQAEQQQQQQQQQPEQQQRQERASPFEQPAAGEQHEAAAAAGGGEDVPPAVADVTVAVQYMVDSGKVAFHKGGQRGPAQPNTG